MRGQGINRGIKLLLIFAMGCRVAVCSEPKYKVSDIPKKLMEDAKAVVRKSEIEFEIASINSATEKVTYAITILNKNGLYNSILKQVYNKFSSIRKINANLYDQNGKTIRIGTTTAIRDQAAFDGYSLYDDYRIKIFDPEYATVPFTVEYTFEIKFDGLLTYPAWIPYEDYNMSVQNSEFSVIAPIDLKFRYLESNLKESYDIKALSNGDGLSNKKRYKWTATDLPAIRKESYGQPLEEFTPVVYLAPNDFEIGGYKGNCESWTNFGLWIRKLNEKRNILSDESRSKIKKLVQGAASDIEKVELLYQYMQNKVRYVSIQEGMGSWQPFEAEIVDRVSYGDCKALANYMKSLLDAVGIKSYYTLVMAGESAPPLKVQFPASHFNHAILCVPFSSDTIWLECTDQQIPFGFLGTFTDDRKVLVMNESGGSIVKTRTYSLDDNRRLRNTIIKISSNGDAESKICTSYHGIFSDDLYRVLRMDKADRENYIRKKLIISGYELAKFSYSEIKKIVPSIVENLDITIRNYASVSGAKFIFRPNIFMPNDSIPFRAFQRISPINIRRSVSELDTVTYIIQGSRDTKFRPLSFSLNSPFGEYKNELSFKAGRLIYTRSLNIFKGVYPKELYSDFVDFFEKIHFEDNKQIVFSNL